MIGNRPTPPTRNGTIRFAVPVLAAVQFVIVVDETAIALLGPQVAHEFATGDEIRHLLITPFAAAFVMLLPLTALALRGLDPRRAVGPAAVAFAVSAAAGALAPSVAWLVAARAAQGATAAVATTCVLASLHLVTMHSSRRTRDFAIFSVLSGAGAMAALLIAAPIATASWRWCFWAVGSAAMVCALGWRAIRGAVGGAAAETRAVTDQSTSVAHGAAGLGRPGAVRTFVSVVAANAVLSATVITASFALQQDHGWTPMSTGLAFLALNAAAAAGAVIVGRSHSGRSGRLLTLGGIALAVGCAGIAVVPDTPLALIGATVPVGLGIGVVFPIVNDRALMVATSRPLGGAAALGTTQQVGLASGAVVAALHSGIALAVLAAAVALVVVVCMSREPTES
ncbi:MFS transporter [Gordonia zhaorongruii]|uniref:MFS transporter n=1 Tax=Gordonia zhaorongruii TaxID=2597659 RepID=UPI001F16B078|nr:MFS transporter [Gordonia zhaorongruii]